MEVLFDYLGTYTISIVPQRRTLFLFSSTQASIDAHGVPDRYSDVNVFGIKMSLYLKKKKKKEKSATPCYL